MRTIAVLNHSNIALISNFNLFRLNYLCSACETNSAVWIGLDWIRNFMSLIESNLIWMGDIELETLKCNISDWTRIKKIKVFVCEWVLFWGNYTEWRWGCRVRVTHACLVSLISKCLVTFVNKMLCYLFVILTGQLSS